MMVKAFRVEVDLATNKVRTSVAKGGLTADELRLYIEQLQRAQLVIGSAAPTCEEPQGAPGG